MPRPIFYTPVKRNHVIAPFGVGAVLLARNGVSVVMCGLDEWLRSRPQQSTDPGFWLESNQLADPFLQNNLNVAKLIQPPAVADEPTYGNTWFIRVARFPLTEYCINPKCRRITTRAASEVAAGRCAYCQGQGRRAGRWPTQQVPLVLACPVGHLSDIPWSNWLHGALSDKDDDATPRACANPALTYRVATDITAPVIACKTCDAELDLGTIRGRRHECPGERPWLPGTEAQPCAEHAEVIERTATNLYYADVRSALYLPHGAEYDHRLFALLAEPLTQLLLSSHRTEGNDISHAGLEAVAELATRRGIATDAAELARHVRAASERSEEQPADESERSRELDVLLKGTELTSSAVGMPPLIVEPRPITDYEGELFGGARGKIEAVSAVPRLAETRVLAGFSRIRPRRVGVVESYALMWNTPPRSAPERDWLPAHRVYGEGFLVVLDHDAVAGWEAATSASDAWYRHGIEVAGRPLGPRDVLAHTLAHVVLREAAAVCGYALPALRERLFVDEDDEGRSRTAFLIYTAEGDSYGTLGGLVELADHGKLEILLTNAIDEARWCGADPVCMNPPHGIGLTTTPGSCHHCTLVPETTCELFNQALDRASLVGLRDGVPGFFDGV